jgi:hypothetical protein
MTVALAFLTKIVIHESAFLVPLDTLMANFPPRHHPHRTSLALRSLTSYNLHLYCVERAVNVSTYCLSVSKSYILREVVGIKSVLLTC